MDVNASTKIDFDQFADLCQCMVRDIGKTFKTPDKDWAPVLFAWKPPQAFTIIALDERFFATAASKDALVFMLKRNLAPAKYHFLCFVCGFWKLELPKPPTDAAMQMVHDHYNRVGVVSSPNKVEALMLMFLSKTQQRVTWALVHRSLDQPPELGPWEGLEGCFTENRFLPLRDALV